MKHLPQQPGTTGILEDDVPVPFGIPDIAAVNGMQNGYCTIEQWRAGQCTATPIVLENSVLAGWRLCLPRTNPHG
jgi:hypothetical protein